MNPNPHEMKTNIHPARNLTRAHATTPRAIASEAFALGMIAGLVVALLVVATVAAL